MKLSALLTVPIRFGRHLHYHRDIIKHIRWTKADARRYAFYSALIRPGDLVFDVGANMGNRSKVFRAIGGRVVAFEPQSYCACFLKAAFSGDRAFQLIQAGLSDTEGTLEMHLSKAHVLSTLDTEWIDRMNQGGRFANQWDDTETVRVTTLDASINKFGMPAFIKIDVEGHELKVLKGLSRPVPSLSLEFASESLGSIFGCIDHLDSIGLYEYRLSLGETMKFDSASWCDSETIKQMLRECQQADPLCWGDIYARHRQ